jgi:hypothetical protein
MQMFNRRAHEMHHASGGDASVDLWPEMFRADLPHSGGDFGLQAMYANSASSQGTGSKAASSTANSYAIHLARSYGIALLDGAR